MYRPLRKLQKGHNDSSTESNFQDRADCAGTGAIGSSMRRIESPVQRIGGEISLPIHGFPPGFPGSDIPVSSVRFARIARPGDPAQTRGRAMKVEGRGHGKAIEHDAAAAPKRAGIASVTKSTDPRDYQHAPGIAAVMPKAFPDGFVVAEHRHPRAQLVYTTTGIAEVIASQSVWMIPPHRALWIPPDLPHAMRAHGPLEMRTVYVDPQAYRSAYPDQPSLVNVSPLLRELIVRASSFPVEVDPDGRDDLVIQLMLAEIEWSPEQPLRLPSGQDRRLARVCDALLEHPADQRTLTEWADEVGASSRTLARLFTAETGLSFSQWRQQARISAARPLLASGCAVIAVAAELGYETTSAFSTVFRRFVGMTPSAYAKLSDSA
ncbi:helix-turn-helix domain-containing protein [Burkholderia sp. AU45251]|uniref:AraC family transcriptional regulator n=1 Tax=Burkholderia sp. AU45251 TaxID=3059204 RepID=UPI00264D2080|nr:helix-turn-helix transcriptional regulator [Burkholderia sp. AU45251]MDN7516206.1 helix-turn-helix transcriptional regulator [Burkholderia sp. AU45251]